MYTASYALHGSGTAHHCLGARAVNPATRQTLQPTRSALQGPRVTDRGPWSRDLGQQEALRTYRDIPLFPALGIGIGAIMRDGGGATAKISTWRQKPAPAAACLCVGAKVGARPFLLRSPPRPSNCFSRCRMPASHAIALFEDLSAPSVFRCAPRPHGRGHPYCADYSPGSSVLHHAKRIISD